MSRFPSSVRFEYDEAHSSNFTRGNWSKNHIVLHWWDNPSRRPTFDGVVSWFKNPSANVSIQYMVEHNRITQMIPESAMAWHSGNSDSNRHGIGIEVNPRLSAGDYETAAVLVAEIWKRRGKLKLRRHRDVNRSTACPGHMDISRIQRRAEQLYSGSTPASSTPVLEGEVMTSAYDVWAYGNDSVQDGRQVFNMLHRMPSDILYNRDYDYANPGTDNPTSVRHQISRAHQYSMNAASLNDRRLDYVNEENPSTARHQLARAHQYSMNASTRARQATNEAKETKAMVKALASAVDDVLKGQGKILQAVEEAETRVVKANAEEVAAELEVTVKGEE